MSRSAKTDRARAAHKIGRELLACYNSHFPGSRRKPPENRYASERAYKQACIGDTGGNARLEMKLGGRRYGYVQRAFRAALKFKLRKIERSNGKLAAAIEMRDAVLTGVGDYEYKDKTPKGRVK